MKRFLYALTLVIALASSASSHQTGPDVSLAHWQAQTSYKGEVCMVTPDATCSNGVPYTKATVNAYEGYLLWRACELSNHDKEVCSLLND